MLVDVFDVFRKVTGTFKEFSIFLVDFFLLVGALCLPSSLSPVYVYFIPDLLVALKNKNALL